ncbi:MAG TPA: hypothetical protein VL068_12680 [Microthrixaceae bacterium]|nr:hypothetical protein [Microthrixaceae bacterium]
MPTLSFDGETHNELVVKVRRWLASVDGTEVANVSAVEAVGQGAEVTKEALRIIASVAPEPIAQSEVVKGLTSMGYKVTDATKDAVIMGLDTIEEATGGGVVKQASKAAGKVMYQMNSAMARQLLRSIRG